MIQNEGLIMLLMFTNINAHTVCEQKQPLRGVLEKKDSWNLQILEQYVWRNTDI